MALTKKAKILNDKQISICLKMIEDSRHAKRDRLIFLLSVKCAFRAKEIACITWSMVTDAEGSIGRKINLDNTASKGKGGRSIFMHKDVKAALVEYQNELIEKGRKVELSDTVIISERGDSMRPGSIVHWFKRLYDSLGFNGCSSHSGRRTAITNLARKASTVGGSIKDVQRFAGHSKLAITEGYIDENEEVEEKLVHLL